MENNTKPYRKPINKLVGILESGEIVYIHEHHWNGVSINRFDYFTSEMVDDRNNPETLKDTYGYLWQESVADGNTELGLDDYIEEMIESETRYGGSYFVGQDDSYLHHMTNKDHSLLEEHYGVDIETFECVGGGTGYLNELKFAKVFNQQVLDEAIAHEQTIDQPITKLKSVK